VLSPIFFELSVYATPAPQETSITVHFDPAKEKKTSEEDSYLPRIEEIFQNSAIISGLNSGADAINRSVESLMEAVFYNLMDHEFIHPITKDSWFSFLTNRHVYSTATGSYVIVDKIGFGPRFAKELWNIQGVPINLGTDGSVEMLEIYPRSDAGRVAEQKELPTWRKWANNWFGILPILSTVLPPSFNPNEMYDPLREVEAPFSFPLTVASFETMPIGSIRSYGVSGGVQLPLGIGEILDINAKAFVSKFLDSKVKLPYTVFSTGAHRINVLRRGEKLAWVGLSTVNRTGQSIAGIIGNTLFLMGTTIKSFAWAGIPIAIFPIDIELAGALSKKFDQLYEYDLTKESAVTAYLKAVKGDFVPSSEQDDLRKKKGLDTGVRYHFTKIQSSTDATSKNSANVFVAHQSRQQTRSKAELEIRDEAGVFYLLEGVEDQQDQRWDLLVGNEEARTRNQVDLKVDRKENLTDELGTYIYTFKETKNPMDVTVNYQITDRYTDSEEYRQYISDLGQFLQLPLVETPQFPKLDADATRKYRMKAYLDNPETDHQLVPPTPLVLGRFNANAVIAFNTEQIDRIASQPPDVMWGAFAKAFGMDAKVWSSPILREGVEMQMLWFQRLLAYPLRIFNTRFSTADAIHEAQNSINALKLVQAAIDPIDKLEGFYQLFESDHPRNVASALLLLAEGAKVPRKVDFFASPVGYLDPAYKVNFQRLNGLTVDSGTTFAQADRYEIANDKLNAFFPSEIRELREKPTVRNIEVTTREATGLASGVQPHRHIYIRLQIEKIQAGMGEKVYVRFEQAGKVQFGKLVVAEDVLPLKLSDSSEVSPGASLGTLAYDFYLSGPDSPMDSFILNQALDFGGEFMLAISVSRDSSVWSDEKEVRFRIEDGMLFPPE
jgi:hypothetical protein